MVLTMSSAALVDLSFGLGRSAFGAGGGGAAVWGEEAFGDSDVADGTTRGGEFASDGSRRSLPLRSADIKALRVHSPGVALLNAENRGCERRAAWPRRDMRVADAAIDDGENGGDDGNCGRCSEFRPVIIGLLSFVCQQLRHQPIRSSI